MFFSVRLWTATSSSTSKTCSSELRSFTCVHAHAIFAEPDASHGRVQSMHAGVRAERGAHQAHDRACEPDSVMMNRLEERDCACSKLGRGE